MTFVCCLSRWWTAFCVPCFVPSRTTSGTALTPSDLPRWCSPCVNEWPLIEGAISSSSSSIFFIISIENCVPLSLPRDCTLSGVVVLWMFNDDADRMGGRTAALVLRLTAPNIMSGTPPFPSSSDSSSSLRFPMLSASKSSSRTVARRG